ncbi:MAG: hypothetical protein QOE78_2821 [Alphaproteobacteria bacterium]|jgi:hypothetical protein|nr:hypothetical protein [Alphaproteobacteria bacterium]
MEKGRSPTELWPNSPNLRLRPHAPATGRGRVQLAVWRAFHAHGDELTSSDVYAWCDRWGAKHPRGHMERWNVSRVLRTIADPIGRAPTRGRPWIWRLKQPAADSSSAPPD